MKLGEALSERAALSRRIADLRNRIAANISHLEDETPPENAAALLEEANTVADQLGTLIYRINATNALTPFPGGGNITLALSRRDVINTKLGTLNAAVTARGRGWGYGRAAKTELKTVYGVDIPAAQGRIGDLEAERRQLDAQLQTLSWTTDLHE